jgi:uncharacterized membrane-anchored protein YhcB (DUF1043 family)
MVSLSTEAAQTPDFPRWEMNMIAAWIIAVLAILVSVLLGLALTNLPVWWPPSRRARFTRRTEAVRQGLEAIRASIARRQSGELSEAERSALNAEIDDLLTLLPARDCGAASLWRSSSVERKSFDHFTASLVTLIRALDTRLAAVTGVQPVPTALPPGAPSFPPGGAPMADEVRAGTPPAKTGSVASDYRDAALLAEISKKFYESWAFKGLSAALLAGVALAAGGTFLLGGESYRLSEQLQKSYDRGASQIEKIQDQAQTSLTKETDMLKTTTAAVQTQANQFSADAAKAIATLREEQQNFTDKLKTDTVDKVVQDLRQDIERRIGAISDRIRAEENGLQPKFDALSGRVANLNTGTSSLEDGLAQQAEQLKTATVTIQMRSKQFDTDVTNATAGLKTNAVDKVVQDLRQDIERRIGAISDRIRAEENGLQPKFDALAARVTALNTTATTSETNLGTAHDTMEKLKPRLGPLEQNASAAEQSVARIQAADSAAAQSKTQAEGYAATALQAQRDAAASRDRVATQLDTVANGIPPQRAALDQITAAVATLRTSLQQATDSIAGATQDAAKLKEVAATVQSMSGQLSTLNQTVTKLQAARLEERIAALETNKPPPPPVTDTGTRTLDNLTAAERCAVQSQLNANGFGSGTIDGTFGPATYGAIQRWQHSVGVAENGRLEPVQIDSLIGKRGVAVPPCPKR